MGEMDGFLHHIKTALKQCFSAFYYNSIHWKSIKSSCSQKVNTRNNTVFLSGMTRWGKSMSLEDLNTRSSFHRIHTVFSSVFMKHDPPLKKSLYHTNINHSLSVFHKSALVILLSVSDALNHCGFYSPTFPLYSSESKYNKFQHIARAGGVVLFFGTAGNHNRNTAVLISPGSPGATGGPEHMFVNDQLQKPQWELLVAEVCTLLHLKLFEWLNLLLNV